MKNKYKHFSEGERYVLSAYLKDGLSFQRISDKLSRSVSTVSYEVNTNGGRKNYNPDTAHFRAMLRKWNANRRNPMKCGELWDYVIRKLKERWSPEQISGRLELDFPDDRKMRISHETVYAFINSEEGRELKLSECLRRKKLRKQRKTGMKALDPKKAKIPNRISISERPKEAGEKNRFGDWESDLMEGRKETKAAVSVQKEKKGQYVCLRKTLDKSAEENNRAIKRSLSVFPEEILLTMTFDNGTENAGHEDIRKTFQMKTYFCDAYAAWQKGSVENVIGLVRDYLPKGTDLSGIPDEKIQAIQDSLNSRPRKCLGWLTPDEVLFNHIKSMGVRLPA